jgi:hypothetical protein
MRFCGGWYSPRSKRAKPDAGPHTDSASPAGFSRYPECVNPHPWLPGTRGRLAAAASRGPFVTAADVITRILLAGTGGWTLRQSRI